MSFFNEEIKMILLKVFGIYFSINSCIYIPNMILDFVSSPRSKHNNYIIDLVCAISFYYGNKILMKYEKKSVNSELRNFNLIYLKILYFVSRLLMPVLGYYTFFQSRKKRNFNNLKFY
jgi:hypothetical protein